MIPFTGAKMQTVGDDVYLTLRTTKEYEPAVTRLVFDSQKNPLIGAEFGIVDGKDVKKPKTRDMNAYAWALIDKLAVKMRRDKIDVYRDEIRGIGGNAEIVCVPEKAVQKLCENWGKGKVGWITETMESKLPGCKNVVLYFGSSTFDRSQMQRFIDNIIEDCKAVGIEVLPEEKLATLMEEHYAKK